MAGGGEVSLEVLLAEYLTLLLNKASIDEWRLAVRVGANEMVRTPFLF